MEDEYYSKKNNHIYRCNIAQDCCGNLITWKMNPTTKVAIPSNSRPNPRPSTGRGTTQQGGKWSNYDVDSNLYVGGVGFICRRGGRTTCGGKTGGFAPNPIRHWRKQLFPRQGGCPGKSRVSCIQDRPGSAITLTENGGNDFQHNYTEIYINQLSDHASCEKLEDYCFIKNMKKRSRPITSYSKDYHTSNSTYLQSRGQRFSQQSAVNFKKMRNFPCLNTWIPPNYPGLYNTTVEGCFEDPNSRCELPLVYNPINTAFGTNTAVSGSLYAKSRNKNNTTNNQFNIINKWGLDGVKTTKDYPTIRGKRGGHIQYSGGTGQKEVCCPRYIPPPEWLGEGFFIFELPNFYYSELRDAVQAIPNTVSINKDIAWIPIVFKNPSNININTDIIIEDARDEKGILNNKKRITVRWGSYQEGDIANYGFTMYYINTILTWYISANYPVPGNTLTFPGISAGTAVDGTVLLSFPMPLDIIQWGGIPLCLTHPTGIWKPVGGGNWHEKNRGSYIFGSFNEGGSHSIVWSGINKAITLTNKDLPINQWNITPRVDVPRILSGEQSFINLAYWSHPTKLEASPYSKASTNRWCGKYYNCTQVRGQLSGFPDYGNINYWDVSVITNMKGLFESREGYGISDLYLGDWNTINVTNIDSIFKNNKDYQGNGIDRWNLSNCSNINSAFEGCESFNANLSSWNLSNITTCNKLFFKCKNFNGIGVENWTFDNSSGIIMDELFSQCFKLNLLENVTINNDYTLANWNMINCTNAFAMFKYAYNYTGKGIRDWDTQNINEMQYMFFDTNFNEDIGEWSLNSLATGPLTHQFADGTLDIQRPYRYVYQMFYKCENLSVRNITSILVKWGKQTLSNTAYNQVGFDLGSWNTGINGQKAKITIYTDKYGVYRLIDYYGWKFGPYNDPDNTNWGPIRSHIVPSYLGIWEQYGYTGKTDWSLAYYNNIGTSKFGTYPYDISGDSIVRESDFSLWADDANIVTNMSGMFIGCYNWDGSGVQLWKTDSLINSSFMFQDVTPFNQDLSGWTTDNLINAESMFQRCPYYTGQGLENWNVSKLTNAKICLI